MKKINISNDEMMVFFTKALTHTEKTFTELFDFQINIEEIKNELEVHRKRLEKITDVFNAQLRSNREELVIKDVKKEHAELSVLMDKTESSAIKHTSSYNTWNFQFEKKSKYYAQYYFVYNYLSWIISYLSDKENPHFTFTNNFDVVNTKKIYTHFKEGLVDSKMLTLEELEKYLKAAFEDMNPPNELFTLKNKTNEKSVYKIFHTYFKDVAGKPYGKKDKYVELLSRYFHGYKKETVKTNWTKHY